MTIRVSHLIAGLPVGGAERMLAALCKHGRDVGIKSSVVCLGPSGPVSDDLTRDHIAVEHLGLETIWKFPLARRAIRDALASQAPDVIQAWMYHSNLAATLAARRLDVPVAWNIRQSLHRPDLFKATTRLVIRTNARLSRRSAAIVYNSGIARSQHEQRGFDKSKGVLIPNGVDVGKFAGDVAARRGLREAMAIDEDVIVAVAVGRANAIKGHEVLLAAVRIAANSGVPLHFLLVGEGVTWDAPPYAYYRDEADVQECVTLAGSRHDIPDVLMAADLFVSSSWTEGFPNAVAEAMAAGLPCVVTDVGDSALLAGDTGRIVDPGNPQALADAVVAIAMAEPSKRHRLGAAARDRVRREFSMQAMCQRYRDLYRSLQAG